MIVQKQGKNKIGIEVNAKKCVGCRTCELACSFSREKVFCPDRSLIGVFFGDDGSVDIRFSAPCDCGDRYPLCADLCPTGAIDAHPQGPDRAL